jgi:hypothetical protein
MIYDHVDVISRTFIDRVSMWRTGKHFLFNKRGKPRKVLMLLRLISTKPL